MYIVFAELYWKSIFVFMFSIYRQHLCSTQPTNYAHGRHSFAQDLIVTFTLFKSNHRRMKPALVFCLLIDSINLSGLSKRQQLHWQQVEDPDQKWQLVYVQCLPNNEPRLTLYELVWKTCFAFFVYLQSSLFRRSLASNLIKLHFIFTELYFNSVVIHCSIVKESRVLKLIRTGISVPDSKTFSEFNSSQTFCWLG